MEPGGNHQDDLVFTFNSIDVGHMFTMLYYLFGMIQIMIDKIFGLFAVKKASYVLLGFVNQGISSWLHGGITFE
jgi:hypothetical protein